MKKRSRKNRKGRNQKIHKEQELKKTTNIPVPEAIPWLSAHHAAGLRADQIPIMSSKTILHRIHRKKKLLLFISVLEIKVYHLESLKLVSWVSLDFLEANPMQMHPMEVVDAKVDEESDTAVILFSNLTTARVSIKEIGEIVEIQPIWTKYCWMMNSRNFENGNIAMLLDPIPGGLNPSRVLVSASYDQKFVVGVGHMLQVTKAQSKQFGVSPCDYWVRTECMLPFRHPTAFDHQITQERQQIDEFWFKLNTFVLGRYIVLCVLGRVVVYDYNQNLKKILRKNEFFLNKNFSVIFSMILDEENDCLACVDCYGSTLKISNLSKSPKIFEGIKTGFQRAIITKIGDRYFVSNGNKSFLMLDPVSLGIKKAGRFCLLRQSINQFSGLLGVIRSSQPPETAILVSREDFFRFNFKTSRDVLVVNYALNDWKLARFDEERGFIVLFSQNVIIGFKRLKTGYESIFKFVAGDWQNGYDLVIGKVVEVVLHGDRADLIVMSTRHTMYQIVIFEGFQLELGTQDNLREPDRTDESLQNQINCLNFDKKFDRYSTIKWLPGRRFYLVLSPFTLSVYDRDLKVKLSCFNIRSDSNWVLEVDPYEELIYLFGNLRKNKEGLLLALQTSEGGGDASSQYSGKEKKKSPKKKKKWKGKKKSVQKGPDSPHTVNSQQISMEVGDDDTITDPGSQVAQNSLILKLKRKFSINDHLESDKERRVYLHEDRIYIPLGLVSGLLVYDKMMNLNKIFIFDFKNTNLGGVSELYLNHSGAIVPLWGPWMAVFAVESSMLLVNLKTCFMVKFMDVSPGLNRKVFLHSNGFIYCLNAWIFGEGEDQECMEYGHFLPHLRRLVEGIELDFSRRGQVMSFCVRDDPF